MTNTTLLPKNTTSSETSAANGIDEEAILKATNYTIPIGLIICLVLIFLSIATITIILKDYNLRNTSSNIFIANLAFVDLTLACSTLFRIFTHLIDSADLNWGVLEVFRITYATISTLSLLSTFANSVDRYTYIRHSMTYHRIVTVSRTKWLVGMIWIFSILFGLFPLIVNLITSEKSRPGFYSKPRVYGNFIPLCIMYMFCSIASEVMFIILFIIVRKRRLRLVSLKRPPSLLTPTTPVTPKWSPTSADSREFSFNIPTKISDSNRNLDSCVLESDHAECEKEFNGACHQEIQLNGRTKFFDTEKPKNEDDVREIMENLKTADNHNIVLRNKKDTQSENSLYQVTSTNAEDDDDNTPNNDIDDERTHHHIPNQSENNTSSALISKYPTITTENSDTDNTSSESTQSCQHSPHTVSLPSIQQSSSEHPSSISNPDTTHNPNPNPDSNPNQVPNTHFNAIADITPILGSNTNLLSILTVSSYPNPNPNSNPNPNQVPNTHSDAIANITPIIGSNTNLHSTLTINSNPSPNQVPNTHSNVIADIAPTPGSNTNLHSPLTINSNPNTNPNSDLNSKSNEKPKIKQNSKAETIRHKNSNKSDPNPNPNHNASPNSNTNSTPNLNTNSSPSKRPKPKDDSNRDKVGHRQSLPKFISRISFTSLKRSNNPRRLSRLSYDLSDFQTARNLFILLGVYILLWSPNYILLFLSSVFQIRVEHYFLWAYLLAILNSIIDFFVYPMRVKRIRIAFLEAFKNHCSCFKK